MSIFDLQHFDGTYAVYAARDNLPSAKGLSFVYLLCPAAAPPENPLAFENVWPNPAGWALIVRAAPWNNIAESPAAAAATLRLRSLTAQTSLLAWQPAPATYQILQLEWIGSSRQLRGVVELHFGNVTLTLPAGLVVSLNPDNASLHFAQTGTQLTITRSDAHIGSLTYDSADLAIAPCTLAAAGGLLTRDVTWGARQVFLLGQDANQVAAPQVDMPEIRYWQDPGTGTPLRLRLPLFPQVDVNTPDLTLSFALNPAQPYAPGATRFEITNATAACFTTSSALLTREAGVLGLAPVGDIGFHLAPGLVNGCSTVYLAPHGNFTLTAASGNDMVHLQPGLSGLERIEAVLGDTITLEPGHPAYGAPASQGQNGRPDQTPQLTAACTTAWLRLAPAGAPSRPYYAQPLASVFYASADGTALPRAADALVAFLTGVEPAYPLAPYANAFQQGVCQGMDAAAIGDFERLYLSSTRGAILGSQAQPVFSLDGTALAQLGATPRGLLAEIGPARSPPAAHAALCGMGIGLADPPPTPAGQWRRLYLARGVQNMVTLEPQTDGVVNPVISNALMQPGLFLVHNRWTGNSIGLAGKLDVGGFSFEWMPEDGKDASMLLVAKFTTEVSLQDMFAMPAHWRDAQTLANIPAAQKAFAEAMAVAQAAKAASSTLFDDFLQRIATSPRWTGIVVFNAPVEGDAMPPTLQILVAGMASPLRAHHLAVDVTVLTAQGGVPQDLGPSSVAGVISYDDPGNISPIGPDGYGFYTQSLKVGIFASVVTNFSAKVGLAATRLFGRPATLHPLPGDPDYPDTFLIDGTYQIIAGVPTVSFQLATPRVFDFPTGPSLQGGGFNRILNRFEITSAGILPQPSQGNLRQAQIALGGGLWFSADPFGVGIDLFSYGTERGPSGPATGLALENFSLNMSFSLDEHGKRTGPPVMVVDYSRLNVTAPPAAVRPGSLVAGLPLKLKGILADGDGLDTAKLGGKPVNVLQLAGQETQTPHFALQLEMIIGSLGELSGVHAGLTAEMRLAWGPLATTADADGALLTVQLPGASAGFNGLNVHGMLQLVFGDANIMQVAYTGDGHNKPANVFVLLFNNVGISLMGIKLPPKVISDLILFSDPTNAAGSSLAACLTVRQQ